MLLLKPFHVISLSIKALLVVDHTSSKGEITSQIPPLHLQCSVAVEKMFSKWAG